MHYVYILQSKKDNKYYIGQTNNIEKRLETHNKGYVKSTRNRKPFELVVQHEYVTKLEAIRMERYLKSLKGGNEFKKIIEQWGVAKR